MLLTKNKLADLHYFSRLASVGFMLILLSYENQYMFFWAYNFLRGIIFLRKQITGLVTPKTPPMVGAKEPKIKKQTLELARMNPKRTDWESLQKFFSILTLSFTWPNKIDWKHLIERSRGTCMYILMFFSLTKDVPLIYFNQSDEYVCTCLKESKYM